MSTLRRVAQSGRFAVILIALGAGLLLWSRLADARGNHAFNHGQAAPATVRLTQGAQYQIATRDGVSGLARLNFTPDTLHCSLTPSDGVTQPLVIQAEQTDSKATHVIATFTAPTSGDVRITCDRLGAVYVDDADNTSGDLAGLLVVLSTIALVSGVALALSWLYRRRGGLTQAVADRTESPA